jgi:hypothetical protein
VDPTIPKPRLSAGSATCFDKNLMKILMKFDQVSIVPGLNENIGYGLPLPGAKTR